MSTSQEKMINFLLTIATGIMSFLAFQVWNLNGNISELNTDMEYLKEMVGKTVERQKDFEDIVNERTKDRFTKSDAKELKEDLGKRIDANTDLIKAIKKD